MILSDGTVVRLRRLYDTSPDCGGIFDENSHVQETDHSHCGGGKRSTAFHWGRKSLFDSEQDLELISCSLAELGPRKDIDLVLLGTRAGQNLFDVMAGLKAARPDLRIIVTGSGADDETILKALAAGAKGYVDEAASPAEFIQALRIVHQGSVWGAQTRTFHLYRARYILSRSHIPSRTRNVY